MTDLQEISVERREDGSNGVGYGIVEDSSRGKQKYRGPEDLNGANEDAGSNRGSVRERGSGGDAVPGGQPVDGTIKVERSTQEDHRTRFYEHYRKEAKEYDDEFMKKHDEDLNTTLIFAGLFSAVTSAFIVQAQSQLQPDPNQETAALLRVLIHKIDNTTFGGDVPALPRWTGPPRTIVHVQSILYASLFTSLLSAFLAMLGKQWLNRYASIDMRGSAIERSQNRQRKLDGIVVWYFDHVMESLPVMLQIALLLLGCALSRYLWEINTTVAFVVLGVTSFGVLFLLFIVFAGTTSDSCPYQTPAANAIRHVLGVFRHVPGVIRRVPGLLRYTHALLVKYSMLYYGFADHWRHADWSSPSDIIMKTLTYPLLLLIWFVIDAFCLGRATFWFDHQTIEPDFRCISWMLQTSLDKTINMSTLKFLEAILPLSDPNSSAASAVVMDCFDILISCFVTGSGRVTRGSEQLAGISTTCFLRAFSCLLSTEPTSTVIRDICQRYNRVFPDFTVFEEIPLCFTMNAIHHLASRPWRGWLPDWRDYDPSADELIPLSRTLAHAARFGYHGQPEVPEWLVRFALHFLSQDQLPPTSVVLDCLTIIAIGLGCNVPHANNMAPDEDAELELFFLIVQEYDTIGPDDLPMDRSTVNATIAFLPYMARWEDSAIIPTPLKYAILDAVQYECSFLKYASNIGTVMRRWMAVASALPYTEDIGWSVADTLLQMASSDELSPHIPGLAWDWLKKRPDLPVDCDGLRLGALDSVVQMVRKLQDVELIASYLFVVWSERTTLSPKGCSAIMIREELCGIEAAGYRADLIQRLDYVLSRLDPRFSKKQWYEELRTALLEVDEGVTKTLTGCHSTFMRALPLPCP